MSRRNDHKHHPAPFSVYNLKTTASLYISNHENRGQKKTGKQCSNRVAVLGKARACTRGGGGGVNHVSKFFAHWPLGMFNCELWSIRLLTNLL